MAYGVRFGAELPLHIVLTPQLKSLAAAFDRTQQELKELVDLGWYALFDYLPFIPIRMHPKGSTERKWENRPRPTTDCSHPHAGQDKVDTQGDPVVSINEAILTGLYNGPYNAFVPSSPPPPTSFQPGMPPWWNAYATWAHVAERIPNEYKLSITAIARDSAILAYPARCSPNPHHQPEFVFVDDFRNYFSQIPVAPEDYWKTVVAAYSHPHLAPNLPLHLMFVAEYRYRYRLGFGITRNSNTNFILHTVITEFR